MTKEYILNQIEFYAGIGCHYDDGFVQEDLTRMLDELERSVVIDGVEYVAESPSVKTISKDGEVVISGFREVKK